MRSLVVIAVLAAPAAADTLGFPPCTAFSAGWSAHGPGTTSGVYVARDTAMWRELWKRTGGPEGPPRVDFDTQMVVGIETSKGDRVIYRVELDNAAHPTALVVRAGYPDAPCAGERTTKGERVQFVVVPRSHLRVRFVSDEMIDGRMFTPANEGVESKEIGVLDVTAAPPSKDAAVDREQAERLVVASLSAADRAKLVVGPLSRPMQRVPHAWTKTSITRDATTWTIRYDDLMFSVDVHTGKVTRR